MLKQTTGKKITNKTCTTRQIERNGSEKEEGSVEKIEQIKTLEQYGKSTKDKKMAILNLIKTLGKDKLRLNKLMNLT